MTIISKPAVPTFIVSTPNLQGFPDVVRSVYGRIGDIVALQNDYNITQIDPEGATTGDVIVVESGQFVVKSLEISGQSVQTSVPTVGDIIEFNGSNWAVTSNTARFQVAEHAALTDDVHGLQDDGPGTNFLADDGTYKAVVVAAPVASVFGRVGAVVAAFGDYSIADISGLTTVGSPTDFLGADGIYKPITHPPDVVISVFGRTGAVVAANNDYTLPQIDGLIDSGGGTDFLADDGTYKGIPSARQIVAPTLADGTTISSGAAHTTVFDFAPNAVYRNNNCLLTIHYQAHNIPGNAQAATWLRSNIGLTVQQNAYHGTVAMDSNGDERLSFTVVMEGIVSASGNIEIEVRADGKDQDFSNSAAAGKTRLTIELV